MVSGEVVAIIVVVLKCKNGPLVWRPLKNGRPWYIHPSSDNLPRYKKSYQ